MDAVTRALLEIAEKGEATLPADGAPYCKCCGLPASFWSEPESNEEFSAKMAKILKDMVE